MTKLTKQDKINLYQEYTFKHKNGVYLSKKYGLNVSNVNYLIALIKRHGLAILDKSYTSYTKGFKEKAIKRVLCGNEAAYALSLELGLTSSGLLNNWLRAYKENGYNVLIRKKGRKTLDHNKEKKQLRRLKQENAALKRQNLELIVENALIKKLSALVQQREDRPKQKLPRP